MIGDAQAALEWLDRTYMTPTQPSRGERPVTSANTKPATDADDDALLDHIRRSRQGRKFERLWSGETGGDHSAADLSLCSILVFWTEHNIDRADRLFRRSGLFRAEKWDKRHFADGRTYGQATLEKAAVTTPPKTPARGTQRPKAQGAGVAPAPADAKPPKKRGADPELSDDALALRFINAKGADMRYCAALSAWFGWNGHRWAEDERLRYVTETRAFLRNLAKSLLGDEAKRLRSKVTVMAVELLARADERVALGVDSFDANPWLLNTPGGVVNLRTGELTPNRREDHCNQSTAIAPASKEDCPRWKQFLREATGEDADLEMFLQRMCGYALTGSVEEHALFFAYGTGGNGKGVFVNTVQGVLGTYAKVSPMETFTEARGERHPTELAMLRGARLVTAQETEEGRRWAEGKIKNLTGGDPITARHVRQDFFTFQPQFKLLLTGNHKPVLRSVDESTARRFHIIPFTEHFDAGRRDPKLAEKLRAEWSGILRWAINGCLNWHDVGLDPPTKVVKATEQYLETQDLFGQWLTERCEVATGFRSKTGDLFRSWRGYAEMAFARVGRIQEFTDKLAARGFMVEAPDRATGRIVIGIRLAAREGEDSTDDEIPSPHKDLGF